MPVVLAFASLSACGQKGPLFLAPQSVPYKLLPNNAAVTSGTPVSPATAASGLSPLLATPSPAAK